MSNFSVNLTGQVAIVTDAGTTVGRAVALLFAKAGAAVCVNAINPDRTDQVAEAIHAQGGQALPWTADISNRFQVAAMIEVTRERFNGLQILVNVISVEKRAPLLTLDEYDWRRVLDINLTGAFFGTQLAARVMVDEGGGVIVNITHTPSPPDSAAFTASQLGVAGLTRASTRELAAQGVRINALAAANITPETQVREPKHVPQGRTGTADEVAAVAAFLCSDAASFINGQTLVVDGGAQIV